MARQQMRSPTTDEREITRRVLQAAALRDRVAIREIPRVRDFCEERFWEWVDYVDLTPDDRLLDQAPLIEEADGGPDCDFVLVFSHVARHSVEKNSVKIIFEREKSTGRLFLGLIVDDEPEEI